MDDIEKQVKIKTLEAEVKLLEEQRKELIKKKDKADEDLRLNQEFTVAKRQEVINLLKGK